jgi:hypothetical protein
MRLPILGVLLLCGAAITPAHAALFTANYGSNITALNGTDDSTTPVALPFTLNFFGTDYNSVNVSTNGNIQFGTSSGSYTPDPLDTTTVIRGIAPFWTDLITFSDPLGSPPGGAGIYVSTPTADQIIFTWDRLGYYVDYTNRVTFQLVLNNPNAPIAPGQAAIGLYYGSVGPQANAPQRQVTIGFGDGLTDINPGEISLFAGRSDDVTAAINAGPGFYLFGLQGGVPTPTPAAPALALFGLGAAALGFARRTR